MFSREWRQHWPTVARQYRCVLLSSTREREKKRKLLFREGATLTSLFLRQVHYSSHANYRSVTRHEGPAENTARNTPQQLSILDVRSTV